MFINIYNFAVKELINNFLETFPLCDLGIESTNSMPPRSDLYLANLSIVL